VSAEELSAYSKYVASFVNKFEEVLYSDKFKDKQTGWSKYIDKKNFIDYLLITEFTKNIDGLRFSTYLHKQHSARGKLRMGPVWDYDIAYGNVYYASCHTTTGFRHNSHDPVHIMKLTWYDRLMQDRSFCVATVKRWRHLRRTALSNNHIFKLLNSLHRLLSEAAKRNFKKWNILGRYVWPEPAPYAKTFADEIKHLKLWIRRRLWWMDGMRCAANTHRLYSKHILREPPPLLQSFTYINEVGKSYRQGDRGAILRTLGEAAAPPHCWTCAHLHQWKDAWSVRGQFVWLLVQFWHKVYAAVRSTLCLLVIGCVFIPLCTRFYRRKNNVISSRRGSGDLSSASWFEGISSAMRLRRASTDGNNPNPWYKGGNGPGSALPFTWHDTSKESRFTV